MNISLVPALIALIGVFFSALTSFYISTRQSKIEIRKLRDEYSHRYAGKVFEKRLEAYPKVVEHLVVFFHKVNLSEIKRNKLYEIKVDDIKNLLQALLDWDTQNAILYSTELQNVFHSTYHKLYRIINKPNDELRQLVAEDGFLLELRNELFKLFLALKNDLGIYSFESPSVITGFKSPNTVKDFTKSAG
ncbi:MAG TPA: hypothetical protein VLE49_13040 [Anaerolineales bacterium]|nr:hypothetical protein [Anaerolineales bacterium]